MPLTKDKISKLEIPEELKTDILSLFTDIESQQNIVDDLRKKVPTDSQTVVESVDFNKFKEATTELERLKKEMEDKIKSEGGENEDGLLSAFRSFFS